MSIKTWIIFILLIGLLSSCASKREVWYFQDADYYIPQEIYYEPVKIQPNDILNIKVSALIPATAEPYNTHSAGGMGNSNIELLKLEGYLVGEDGTITKTEAKRS